MAHVIGNSGRVFPNSHSSRLTADNPASQHRISAIKTGDINKLLIYVSFFAVPTGRAFQYRTVFTSSTLAPSRENTGFLQ